MSVRQRPTHCEGLEVNPVADGLVVYQSIPEQVHYLNNTSAVIFELCDGNRTLEEITEQVRCTFSLERPPASEVETCVAELMAKGVVQ